MSRPLACDISAAVEEILRRAGPRIALGIPLGLGKPVPLVNALYRRVAADPALHLKILSALSLEKPSGASAVERAFLEPFVQRVYGDCPDLDYIAALRGNRVPPNVEICEFFFRPGSMLGSAHAQQHYVSSNYTHAARDVAAQGCNVLAQMVAKRSVNGVTRYSLSCNPDTGLELAERLRAAGRPLLTVGVVSPQLPYMGGDAEVAADFFDLIVEDVAGAHALFSTPKLPVGSADACIGLHASSLIRDGGTLQVGIGSLGDAVVYAALLRHQKNDTYRRALHDAGTLPAHAALVHETGGVAPFERGLYGASEMLVDGFMDLHRAGILKRRVYGFWALQQLVNAGRCDPGRLTPQVFDDLASLGVRVIRGEDFEILQHHGLLNDDTRYDHGFVIAPGGERVIANVADAQTRRVLGEHCLGARLRHGTVVNAAFFLGSNAFYDWLRGLPEEQRAEIGMTRVERVNQLDHNPRLYQQQRLHSRFMNTGLMATLMGEVVSDGLEDGRVLSGVGGQYNFVAMAHHLATGRSILMIRAARPPEDGGTSNVVWHYGHCTIPRHLRDLVVTEYGIADLRSRTDRDVIAAMLNVADSRFQPELLAQAQRAGKIEAGYRIPDAQRNNTPESLERRLAPHRAAGLFPDFPLGSDFTAQEQVLLRALKGVKARAAGGKLALLWDVLKVRKIPDAVQPYLKRLQLAAPATFEQRLARKLLVLQLGKAGIR